MKNCNRDHSFALLWMLVFSGYAAEALLRDYDYAATTECLVEPEAPQYGGGVIENPGFGNKLNGWNFSEKASKQRTSNGGNRFIVVHNATQPLYIFSQKLNLEEDKLYSLSAWVQISEGSEQIQAVFRNDHGLLLHAGSVTAKQECWSMLKGGIRANFSSPYELYFKSLSNNSEVEIWVESISLQPFTEEDWRSHQLAAIEKVRKSKVRIQATYANGTKLPGARVSIKQTRPGFPFGCAMTQNILKSTTYQDWFTSRFKVTTFANEMKWYSTEHAPGAENYAAADAMLEFANKHNIPVRGHNVFWDNPNMQPMWVKSIGPEALRPAAERRIRSVVNRYKGKLIAWDVVNENMHYSYFEDKLGKNISASYYSIASQIDPSIPMFLNEFNTIEETRERSATPDQYLAKIQEIKSFEGNQGLKIGIGLQSHFPAGEPNIPYMRAGIDKLGATGLPLWLTEVDSDHHPNQAQYLEKILREGFSHPKVQGIIIWAGPEVDGCQRMCLTDYNYKNTPAGEVIDKLIAEWKTEIEEARVDSDGYFETSLFHGDYSVTVTHPLTNSTTIQLLNVGLEFPKETLRFQVHV